MDKFDRHILALLMQNARLSYSDIGRKIGLSAPAVTERMKKLESEGIVSGYHAAVDYRALGRSVHAFIRIAVTHDREADFERFIRAHDRVLRCHNLLGSDTFMIEVAFTDVDALNDFIGTDLHGFGQTTTHVVASRIK